jgi:iron complex outermembrane recepter protein
MKKIIILNFLISTLAYGSEELSDIEVTTSEGFHFSQSSEQRKESLRQIPGGVTGIDRTAFEGLRSTTPKDVFEFTPGIFVQTRYGEESRLSIRGSGLSRTVHLRGIRFYQDGIPLNFADGGGDFQELDPASFEFIEVYRGANSFPYAVSTTGGAVNFITKTGKNNPGSRIRFEGGSFGTHKEVYSHGYVDAKNDALIILSNIHSSGFREHSTQKNKRIAGNFGQKLSSNFEHRFYFNYQDVDQELPGNLTKEQVFKDPTSANTTAKLNDQKRDLDVKRLAHQIHWTPNGHEVNAGWFVTKKDLSHPIFQVLENNTWNQGVFGEVIKHASLGSTSHTIKLRSQFFHSETDAKRYTNLSGKKGALTLSSDERAKTSETLLEDNVFLSDELTLTLGGIAVIAEREYRDTFKSDGDRSGKMTYRGFSPRLGLLYSNAYQPQIFANLSQSYEPPTFSELTQSLPGVSGLVNLAPQKALTIEAGVRHKSGKQNYEISLYHSKISDEFISYTLNAGGASGVLNADETIHRGIEAGLETQWLRIKQTGVGARLNYLLSDNYFDDDREWGNNQIPGIPRHYVRFEMPVKSSRLTISPQIEWVPEAYAVDLANTLWANPYVLYGLRNRYELSDKSFAFIDLRNLENKKYIATTGVITRPNSSNGAQFTPGEGFAVFAGGEFSW